MQLKLAGEVSTDPWKISALENALANLKNNKSRDHAGYANELFKKEMIGSDLKLSLLLIKKLKVIPVHKHYYCTQKGVIT